MNSAKKLQKFRTTEPHYVILLWAAIVAAVTLGHQSITGTEIVWSKVSLGTRGMRMLARPVTVYWMYLVMVLWIPAFWSAGRSVSKEASVSLSMVEWLFLGCVISSVLGIFSIAFVADPGMPTGLVIGAVIGGFFCLAAGIALSSGAGGTAGFLSGLAFASAWPLFVAKIFVSTDAGLIIGAVEGYAIGALATGSLTLFLGRRLAARSQRLRSWVRRITR